MQPRRPKHKIWGLESQMDASVVESSGTREFGTTEDQADANVAHDVHLAPGDMNADMSPVMTTGYSQEIRDFLAKPIRIDDFTISPGVDLGKRVYNLSEFLHSDETTNLQLGDIWWDKLKGYYGVKGTFKVRVQINSQPFQCGRMLLVFEPMKAEMAYANSESSAFRRQANLTTLTQLPRVELDYATQTECEMSVPYRTLSSFYNLLNRTGTWGVVTLMEYLPLRVGMQQEPIDVTVWLSLEDAEMAAPTIPVEKGVRPKIKLESQMASDEKSTGPIERAMGTVAKVSTIFENIPYISTIAKPVTWASNIAAKVCSVFGWSRPQNTDMICRFNDTYMQYQTNCNGVDNAFNLGLFADASVNDIPAFGGTLIDEMSIDYIKTRSAWLKTFEWTKQDASGDKLFEMYLAPQLLVSTMNDLILPTPLAGIANCFSYWRGSFKVKFKIAKTIFHSGRLIVAFLPGYQQDNVGLSTSVFDTDFNGTAFLHREVLDIKQQHEFEFEIPYTAQVPYLEVGQPMGKLIVYVQNNLIMMEAASSKIDVAIEVSGAQDFEFALPRSPNWYPAGRDKSTASDEISTGYGSNAWWTGAINDRMGLVEVMTIRDTIEPATGAVSTNFDALYQRITAGGTGTASNIVSLTHVGGKRHKMSNYKYWQFSPSWNITDIKVLDNLIRDNPDAEVAEFHGLSRPQFLLQTIYPPLPSGKILSIIPLKGERYIGIGRLESQMDSGVNTVRAIGATAPAKPHDTEFATKCIGEQVLSMKQLALRSVPLDCQRAFKIKDYAFTKTAIPTRPHMIYPMFDRGTEKYIPDYYSYVGAMYAYARGGTVVRLSGFNTGDSYGKGAAIKSLQILPDHSRFMQTPASACSRFEGRVWEKQGNLCSAYIPPYGPTYGRLVTLPHGNDTGACAPWGQSVGIEYSILNQADEVSECEIRMMRCAADDTQFGFFLGFPPMKESVRFRDPSDPVPSVVHSSERETEFEVI